ncbi:C4-dicarboxylate transporter/malic acid transporter [Sporosarcina newyorkensis 2681]|uniref:C4-dicarboxylate transporter/malic acid transporter n=1 Tax=Sporosarcina newyorkensis 2681 TaxID=1027292 RepID=F9DPR8_9BACL|nr:C4-dicarboxylate transporter/malic acid transporter [Sporosarcina newyorkensis 2681]
MLVKIVYVKKLGKLSVSLLKILLAVRGFQWSRLAGLAIGITDHFTPFIAVFAVACIKLIAIMQRFHTLNTMRGHFFPRSDFLLVYKKDSL